MKSHLLGLLCGCFILASTANADFTTYIYEQEGNTVVAGSGTIDLTGLIKIDDSVFSSRVSPGQGVISGRTPGIGAYSINGVDFYTGIVELGGAFSGGLVSITNEISGDSFGVFIFDVIVPQGYVSGEYFSASMIYRNQTLGNLAMSEFIGSYTWKLPQDTFTLVIGEAPPILPEQVTIDIKPSKKTENVIDLKKGKNLKVAIVGSDAFDALQVNPDTVKFGVSPSEASPVRFMGKDYNHDGFSDLVLTFKLNETGIACGVTEATLTGETSSDPVTNITGSDSFTVEPCP